MQPRPMTMLLVVFRRSLDEEIHTLLKQADLQAFTEAPKVFGMGEAGQAFDTYSWPGHNSMVLAALEDADADRIVQELKNLRDRLSARQGGARIPIRVFRFPCEQLL